MAEDSIMDALLKRRKHRQKDTVSSAESYQREQDESQSLLYPPPSVATDHFSLKKVALVLAAYLTIGAVCFLLVRDQINGKKTNGVLDAIYFCVVTMTTVGYGDLVPQTNLAKFLACVFVFTGMALVGFFLSKAADYIVEKEEILFVKAIHMYETYGPKNVILKEAESNRVKYKFLTTVTFLVFLVIMGILFLSLVEKLSLFDAFYCVCATITTLGYGDKSFSTQGGRLFAIFWILISTLSLAQSFGYLVELSTENRRRQLVDWVLNRKLTIQDLEKADLDNDKVVSAAEYVVFKLKEMGKVTEEEIAAVLKGFSNLDVDHSGTLTIDDIKLSKSSQPQSQVH